MLFTFPSRYWFAIGYRGVLRLGGWSPHVRTGFHGSRPTRGRKRFLPVRGCHPLWPSFPARSGSYACATGLVRVRSPLLAESPLMSFPPATEMFQFAGFASTAYEFSGRYPLKGGFPHSEISGSKIAPISPKLIAGCHVLHRLSVPRHPPNALLSLENKRQFPDAGTSPTPGNHPYSHETTTADPKAVTTRKTPPTRHQPIPPERHHP